MARLLDIFSKKKLKEKEKLKIIVDNREKNSLVASEIIKRGHEIGWKQLLAGDYVVNGVVIERKTIDDLKSSIINKRIVEQLLALKQFEKKVLVVEGFGEDSYQGVINENALRGFLLSVALDFEIGIIFTLDEIDTAKYIEVIGKRKEKGERAVREVRRFKTKKERMQFILEGFPNIGAVKARKLVEKFSSLRGAFNASEEELGGILGQRAKEFRELLE
jgi:ERCC4-type nuclease